MRPSPFASLFAALYEGPNELTAWSENLLVHADKALWSHAGVGLTVTTDRGAEPTSLVSVAQGVPDAGAYFLPGMSRSHYEVLYYPGARVGLMSELAREAPPELAERSREYLRMTSTRDVLGLVAHPIDGHTVVLYSPTSQPSLDHARRTQLERLRLHIENALRTRLRAPHPTAMFSAHEGLSILDDTLLLDWESLIAGTWSAVEHGGMRRYLVFANASITRANHALSALEQRTLEAFLEGHSGKEVAAALGMSQAATSQLRLRIATKLGFLDAADALRFARAVRDRFTLAPASTISPVAYDLTIAERDVLQQMNRGHSPRSIAQLRNASINTVRNQLASLRRKIARAARG